jgi:dipeptidyl aminopeptidase/acylaminoacyl peptidase
MISTVKLVVLALPIVSGVLAVQASEPLTLEQITAEQDWIARSPTSPRWLVDGDSIMYSKRRAGEAARGFNDSYLIDLSDLSTEHAKVTPENPGPFITNSGDWNSDRTYSLIVNGGDLYLFSKIDGDTKQLTRTSGRESSAFFLADESRIGFYRDGNWMIRDLNGMLEIQAADVRFEDAPDDEEKDEKDRSYLEQQQRDLFETIRLEDQRKDIRKSDTKAWRDTNPDSVSGPFYLGKDNRYQWSWMSPSGSHIMMVTAPSKRADNKSDLMPDYINEDGYVSTHTVRSKVGTYEETPHELVLLDLINERSIELSFDSLPMITDDPLQWLQDQKKAKEALEAEASSTDDDTEETDVVVDDESEEEGEDSTDTVEDESEPRPLSHWGTRWNDAGTLAATMLMSHDNKDRWIALVDTTSEDPIPIPIHHLRDEAWIGWDFNGFGFIPGTSTLWYISEESGYGHLYTVDCSSRDQLAEPEHVQRTNGKFEVRSIVLSGDGTYAYFLTNQTHPGKQELERFNLQTNELDQITIMGGTVESFTLSPDETSAVVRYSNINQPPELYLIELEAFANAQKLTDTVTDQFFDTELQTPEIIAVPSSHTDDPIYTRVYLPDASKFSGPRPLVVFSHGAGYLQHANFEWSYYSREHMYHTLLTNLGFIVVSPDFRASSGYGRDWRTAIYRKMGYPELEDFQDCIDWAVENHNADRSKVGIYGGSYGGFMTLMAMFLEPETYKAGAALRSVTDWAHYNHGYTSNILNTPEIDPDSFELCSPINHAEGLQGHLLMLHGMQDNNVVAQDIIRLSQRLIELEKENWELALAPIEPHGYREPSSWLDQMRRIHKLFMTQLATD